MRKVSLAILAGRPLPAGAILEAGCGGGAFAAELAAMYPRRAVVASDLRGQALAVAWQAEAGLDLTQADVGALPFAQASFALVTALDVLDQRDVQVSVALREVHRVMQAGGWLLVRVSAYPWLEGAHDWSHNTGQRYQRTQLVRTLHDAGFRICRVTHANLLLAPLIVMVRLLQRWGLLAYHPTDDTRGLAADVLRRVLAVEAAWVRWLDFPAGISLYVLAVKASPGGR